MPELNQFKVIPVLASFNKKDLRRLMSFMILPEFNNLKATNRLLEYLIAFHPNFDFKGATGNDCLIFVYNDLKSDKRQLSKLFSRLYRCVEQFISYKNDGAPFLREINLLSYYSEHGLTKSFRSTEIKLNKWFKQRLDRDLSYWQDQLRFNDIRLAFYVNQGSLKEAGAHFQEKLNALNRAHLLGKIWTHLEGFNQMSTERLSIELELDTELTNFLFKPNQDNSVVEQVYRSALLLVLQRVEQKEAYFILKQHLKRHSDLLEPKHIQRFISILINSVLRIFSDSKQYYQEFYELFNIQFDSRLVQYVKVVQPMVLRNISVTGLELNKTLWAENLINDLKSKVSDPHKREVIYLCKAMLRFHQKKYEDCLEMLNAMNPKELVYKLDEKRIRAKCYYELGWYDLFEDLINSSKKFVSVHQNSLDEAVLIAYRNFFNQCLKLMNIPVKNGHLLEKISALNRAEVAERKWLMSKLKE